LRSSARAEKAGPRASRGAARRRLGTRVRLRRGEVPEEREQAGEEAGVGVPGPAERPLRVAGAPRVGEGGARDGQVAGLGGGDRVGGLRARGLAAEGRLDLVEAGQEGLVAGERLRHAPDEAPLPLVLGVEVDQRAHAGALGPHGLDEGAQALEGLRQRRARRHGEVLRPAHADEHGSRARATGARGAVVLRLGHEAIRAAGLEAARIEGDDGTFARGRGPRAGERHVPEVDLLRVALERSQEANGLQADVVAGEDRGSMASPGLTTSSARASSRIVGSASSTAASVVRPPPR
jgi:hypothetical protein